jgi:predicted methyltransferase
MAAFGIEARTLAENRGSVLAPALEFPRSRGVRGRTDRFMLKFVKP